jgi:hypothetical protein
MDDTLQNTPLAIGAAKQAKSISFNLLKACRSAVA